MYHFIETIRVENGKMPLLGLHQNRLDRTIALHGGVQSHPLHEIVSIPKTASKGIYKCRVTYTPDSLVDIQFIEYHIRKISTISLVDIKDRDYTFKFSERNWIEQLLTRAGTDEIIMCQNGRITDASYANLVFLEKDQWITPSRPLLRGVRRQQLLQDSIIVEEDLSLGDLPRFSHVKLVNAMMTWDESPELDLKLIN